MEIKRHIGNFKIELGLELDSHTKGRTQTEVFEIGVPRRIFGPMSNRILRNLHNEEFN
jgi:hypothetical protein